MQKLIDNVLDLVAKIDRGDSLETPQLAIQRTTEFAENYEDSYIDLFVVAGLLASIAEELKSQSKDRAYTEAILEGFEEKFTWRGVDLTPVESHKQYDYPKDPKRERYLVLLIDIEEEMKPLKSE
jgi:hypothetical protein